MQRIKLFRHEDVNSTSGEGNVWEGVEFDNFWIAGRWMTPTPTYGWYPSMKHLAMIHTHQGKTEIQPSEYGQLIQISTSPENTTDGNGTVAHGYVTSNGWITLLHLSRYTSVYWYRNIEELQKIIGNRSWIENCNSFYSTDHPVWMRKHIFPQ